MVKPNKTNHVSRLMELAGLDKFKKKVLKENFDQEDREVLHDSESELDEPVSHEMGESPEQEELEHESKVLPKSEIDVGALIKAITDEVANVFNNKFGSGTVDADVEDSNTQATLESKLAKKFTKKIIEQMKRNKLSLSKSGKRNEK